jgi:hypothetical protein
VTDKGSRSLVEARCRRKGHELVTLIASTDGQMRVAIRHHPLFVFGTGPRAAGFGVGVFAGSEDPNGGPPVTLDFDVDGLYLANCQCAQHTITGRRLYEAFRNRQRVLRG